jgi:hypothetical protein
MDVVDCLLATQAQQQTHRDELRIMVVIDVGTLLYREAQRFPRQTEDSRKATPWIGQSPNANALNHPFSTMLGNQADIVPLLSQRLRFLMKDTDIKGWMNRGEETDLPALAALHRRLHTEHSPPT